MAKTLDEGFATLVTRLEPLSSEHDKAISHNASVKGCLERKFECTNFFETGSFGNHTGIRHYSDTDYFAVIPIKNVYSNSGTTLRLIKEAFQSTFPNTTGIAVSTPSVKIPFGGYASETLEVTPCTFNGFVDTPVGKMAAYNIADYSDGWMKSSPSAHNAYVQREDVRLSYKLKPLIRLIKAWKYYNNVPISSFYLELRITKYAETESAIVYDIDIRKIMKFLYDNDLPSIQDPMGISGYIKSCSTDAKRTDALSKLKTGYTRVENASNEKANNMDMCYYWWNLFFSNNFPSR